MNFVNTILLSLLFLPVAGMQSANAASFDFGAYGAALERGYEVFTVTEDGQTLEATGQLYDGVSESNASAYLDGLYAGNPGGFGVCVLTAGNTQCDTTDDDNMAAGEKLTLSFDGLTELGDVTFRNGYHNTAFADDAEVQVRVDGGGWVAYSMNALINFSLLGSTFEFWNDNSFTREWWEYEFYIETLTTSAIPVPAAIWLFGSAMLGLVGIRRKNQQYS